MHTYPLFAGIGSNVYLFSRLLGLAGTDAPIRVPVLPFDIEDMDPNSPQPQADFSKLRSAYEEAGQCERNVASMRKACSVAANTASPPHD